MNVVVTGGAGFIGSHLAQALAVEGNAVAVVDNLSVGDGNLEVLRKSNVRFIKSDIRNLAVLEKAFEGAECVFHLAAMNRAMRSIENPIEANDVNVNGTLNVLEACRARDVGRMIFASSSSVYGGATEKNSEGQKLAPLHPYGVGKLAGEEYSRVYNDLYGVKTTSLRYVSVFGPRQRGDIPYAAVIPRFIEKILAGKPIEVFGTGKQTRQFTFVRDTVNATIQAWKSRKAEGEVFNVASAEESSVLDVAQKIEKITGKKAVIGFKPRNQSDPLRNPIDVSKAKRVFGFKPAFSLEDGLRETVDSFK